MARIAIHVVIPKTTMFDTDYFVREMTRVARVKTVPGVTHDFKRGVDTWEHKPLFKNKIATTKSSLTIDVFPSGKNLKQYLYVHSGVYPRLITPKAGNKTGLLHFRKGYISATKPGSMGSVKASRTGQWVQAAAVTRWPGIPPRRFSKLIAKKHKPIFVNDVGNSLSRATNRVSA